MENLNHSSTKAVYKIITHFIPDTYISEKVDHVIINGWAKDGRYKNIRFLFRMQYIIEISDNYGASFYKLEEFIKLAEKW